MDVDVAEQTATRTLALGEFVVEGMTCATCAGRVERVLSRQPGVTAARVNFASSRASIRYQPDTVTASQLEEAVALAGYRIRPVAASEPGQDDPNEHERRAWRWRVQLAWPPAVTVLLLGMTVGSSDWARWAMFALTVPVQFIAGWPFLRGAAERARHRTANMDTLIAIGTLTAFAFSTWRLLVSGDLYFDTAALIIAFIALGRFFEARAKGRASAAITKLLELGAKQARLLTDGLGGADAQGLERMVPVEQVGVGDRARARPGEKIRLAGKGSAGQPRWNKPILPASRSRSTR